MLLNVGDIIGLYKKVSGGEDEFIKEFVIEKVTKTLAFSGYAKFKRQQDTPYENINREDKKFIFIDTYKLIKTINET